MGMQQAERHLYTDQRQNQEMKPYLFSKPSYRGFSAAGRLPGACPGHAVGCPRSPAAQLLPRVPANSRSGTTTETALWVELGESVGGGDGIFWVCEQSAT